MGFENVLQYMKSKETNSNCAAIISAPKSTYNCVPLHSAVVNEGEIIIFLRLFFMKEIKNIGHFTLPLKMGKKNYNKRDVFRKPTFGSFAQFCVPIY